MGKRLFLLWLLFIKPQKMFSLHSGWDILTLRIIFTPIKTYSFPINSPGFYQLIGRRAIFSLMVLFYFLRVDSRAEFGMVEATMEGLAFPNRPSREPLGAEDV